MWESQSPLFDNMVQAVDRLDFLQGFCAAPFTLPKCFGKFLGKSLVFSKFGENWFMSQICDILGVIERSRRGGTLIRTLSAPRLTRKYACRESLAGQALGSKIYMRHTF
jgi:hypothetical protein